MRNPAALRAGGFAMALGVFGLDRAIKALVAGPLDLQAVGVIKLLPFFDLRWTENYGVSYGMFTADSSETKLMLLAMTGLIACGVAPPPTRAADGAWSISDLRGMVTAHFGIP